MSSCNNSCRKVEGYPAKAITFDIGKAPNYCAGLLVLYSGALYIVGKSGPAGTPGSSADYTAISFRGAMGAVAYDPAKASAYVTGQIITADDGTLYVVGKNNPSGTPGTSSDYTPLTSSGGGRPARGLGATVQPYSATDAASYTPGQLVTYGGRLYVVTNSPPNGTPGSSTDYQNLSGAGPTGPTGANGLVGPTGPTGSAGKVAGAIVQTSRLGPINVGPNTSFMSDASCPPGYIASGGGARAVDASTSQTIAGSAINVSRPIGSPEPTVSGVTPIGWRAIVYFANQANNVAIDAYAICIPSA